MQDAYAFKREDGKVIKYVWKLDSRNRRIVAGKENVLLLLRFHFVASQQKFIFCADELSRDIQDLGEGRHYHCFRSRHAPPVWTNYLGAHVRTSVFTHGAGRIVRHNSFQEMDGQTVSSYCRYVCVTGRPVLSTVVCISPQPLTQRYITIDILLAL